MEADTADIYPPVAGWMNGPEWEISLLSRFVCALSALHTVPRSFVRRGGRDVNTISPISIPEVRRTKLPLYPDFLSFS